MPPLLVLRELDASRRLVAGLRAAGVDAIAAPCLAFEPVAPDEGLLAPLRSVELDLLVASPRSVPALRASGLSPSWRVLALAPATAQSLRAAGLRVDVAVAGGAGELAGMTRPGPVLLATSDIGGAEALAVRPDAIRWETYRTVAPASLPADVLVSFADPYELCAASPSALRHLDRLVPGAVARAERVLCHGATTRIEALRLGARQVVPVRLLASPPWIEILADVPPPPSVVPPVVRPRSP